MVRSRPRNFAAGDGHLELYKSPMKFDGDISREQHGMPLQNELPL